MIEMRKWIGSFLMAATLTAAPQAVVFDFGGVLVAKPDLESIRQFLRGSFHLSESEYEQANQKKREASSFLTASGFLADWPPPA